MTGEFDFSSYIHLVDFLGACFGENTEVVLHSFEDMNHSVIAIHNGHISGRKIGAPLTKFALSKLKDKGKEGPPYYLNYLGMSENNISLRSSSFFILDKQGNPRGMLCINTDVTKYQQAAELLQKLAFMPSTYSEEKENNNSIEVFQATYEEVIQGIINDVTQSAGVAVERLTVDEKVEIVKRLNDEKFFLIKGAVSQVSDMLGVSEATVYRYLSNINKKMKNGE
ncbi:helix-turn-helix transcriptional regulator [Cellulosilyticum sp. I15G10I2]|uniref:helix-turn-helix transcriptional regulator n=1 Tax=Cellulosilyticum sp. I15G10I2 TaxID=1892843 RepID=UPI00085BF1E9|nr:PAS domain-containing protein [Cellulosilyticum sp. I15G10I2]